jgi:hypothetical protein
LGATFAPRLLLRQRFHIVPTLFSFCLILTMTGHGGFAKTQCITYQDRRKPRLNAAASTSCTAEGAILIDPSLVVAMIHSRRVVMTPHLFPPICNIFRSVSSSSRYWYQITPRASGTASMVNPHHFGAKFACKARKSRFTMQSVAKAML